MTKVEAKLFIINNPNTIIGVEKANEIMEAYSLEKRWVRRINFDDYDGDEVEAVSIAEIQQELINSLI